MPENHKKPLGFKVPGDFNDEQPRLNDDVQVNNFSVGAQTNIPTSTYAPESVEKTQTDVSVQSNTGGKQAAFDEVVVTPELKANQKMSGEKVFKPIDMSGVSNGNSNADQSDKTEEPVKANTTENGDVKQEVELPLSKTDGTVVLFGGKVKMPKIIYNLLRMFVPVVAIAICAVLISGMITDTLNDANNIEGKFEIVDVVGDDYINLESDGSFQMNDGRQGIWSLKGNVFEFKQKSGEILEGRFVEKKYIVLADENFYFGDVPSGDSVDASFESANGSTIILDSENNVRISLDTEQVLEGTYMIDSNFIIISVGDTSTTYIKCGDGISSVYYQI